MRFDGLIITDSISKSVASLLCHCCDIHLFSKLFGRARVSLPHGLRCCGGESTRELNRRKHMQTFLVRGFLPMVIGAALLAGCATKDDFRITQTTADAARMQAEEARVAADRAVAAAQQESQRADQANSIAQQAQQTANSAQTAANSASSSAQSAASSAEQARDDAQAAQERIQEAQRPPVRSTRLARGERG